MKTTTVRLDDDQFGLLDDLATIDGCRQADIVRNAVRDYISSRASTNPAFAARVANAVQRRKAASDQKIRDTFGEVSLPEEPRPESASDGQTEEVASMREPITGKGI